MRRRTGILLVAAVIVLAFVTVTLLRRPPDPSYQGKRLSAWLEMYDLSRPRWPSSQWPRSENDQAMDAIRHIGTNALPLLLHRLNCEPPLSRYPILLRLPKWILNRPQVRAVLANPSAARRAAAARDAFGVLGPAATPAIPELTRFATVKKPSARRENSILALSHVLANSDHPPIPALMAVLSALTPQAHLNVMPCLRQLGTNGHRIVPLLLQNLRYTNSYVPTIDAKMLGGLRLEPDVVVPALAKCLQDPRFLVRVNVASALAEFGEAGSAALPALTNALPDPDFDLRYHVARAIEAIAPKVSTAAAAQ